MAGKDVNSISASLSADGSAAGWIPLADVTGFYAGAEVFLASATVDPVQCRIKKVDTTNNRLYIQVISTTLGTKLNGANYGYSDMSGFHLADTAKIYQTKQFIYNAV